MDSTWYYQCQDTKPDGNHYKLKFELTYPVHDGYCSDEENDAFGWETKTCVKYLITENKTWNFSSEAYAVQTNGCRSRKCTKYCNLPDSQIKILLFEKYVIAKNVEI